jgi:hypothetical protein
VPLTGDLTALGGYLKKLQKLPEASREIAVALAPKVAGLVEETFSNQASPVGAPWPATKSGAAAFGGSAGLGYVFSRLRGLSVVTSVLFPLHFHQDGTRTIGKKRMRAIRSKILGAAGKSAAKAIRVPKKAKGESDFAFQQRLAAMMARKAARKEAVEQHKKRADFAAEEAREASGYHDPPRPMLPEENDAPPDRWESTIRETAQSIMAKYGATEAGK